MAEGRTINIAIDGPSGAGKSTIARMLSKELGFLYVDTGAMFRAVALYLDRMHCDIEKLSAEEWKEYLQNIQIELSYVDAEQHVLLNGEDVSGTIRKEEIGKLASRIAKERSVRDKLLLLQREIAKNQNIVMDGRDIGSVVLPDAQVKIFLTAGVQVRAERRYEELRQKGVDCDLEQIKQDIEKRDEQDSTRRTAPLVQAEDALYLDSSELSLQEVVCRIKEEVARVL